jgi:hypothetical protein
MIYRLINLRSVSGLAILLRLANGVTGEDAVMSSWKGKKSRLPELIDAVETPPSWLCEFLSDSFADIVLCTRRIEELENKVVSVADEYGLSNQIERMSTCPTITTLLAIRYIGEMGADFCVRYPSPVAFGMACGVAPKNIITGGNLVAKGTGKGNRYVKRHAVLAVRSWLLRAPDSHPMK